MENMENVGMNGEVKSEIAADAINSGLGKTVAKGVVTVALVGLGIKGAIWAGKKIKSAFTSKKAKNADIVTEDYDEVDCEE